MSSFTITSKKLPAFLSLIYKALKGEQQDYTTGSIRTAVILLAIPMILEMSMESVFAIVDLFFVSKLGKHAISTVGLTESVLTVIYSLAIGLSMAATATVARRVGEKNYNGAASAAMQCLWLAIAVIAVISVIGFIWAKDILRLMGAEPETVRQGTTYIRIMLAGSAVVVLLFLINGIFRGAGDASIAMKSLILANIFNIILCPLLINGYGFIPAMGLTGAAVATTIGRGLGVCYQLFYLINGKSLIKLTAAKLVLEWQTLRSLIALAWPATLQFVIASCSWIFLAYIVAVTGHSEASAGYQTALRIIMFFILPAWGISNAAATLVGQNLGAKEYKRAEDAVWKTAKYNAIFMGIVSLLFFIVADPIVSIFSTQAEVHSIAVTALQIISAGYIFYGVGMVMTNAFNGAGDTRTPTVINLIGFWFIQVPMAYLLAKSFDLGPIGVFISIPVAETMITIAAFVIFRKGKWKTISV
jgi:putative MATE family efflux protein